MPRIPEENERPGLSKLQLALLVTLVLALVGSAGWRFYAKQKGGHAADVPANAIGLVQGEGDTQSEPAATPLERSLPYVTEGSFFALIGFALGYASRKFVKVGLILAALFFLGLQALVWTGNVSVDWSGMIGKLNALIFNLKESESVTEFLTRRIPSAGGMLAGYLIGFQRG